MPPFAQIPRIVAFLRSETPVEDISANPVVVHQQLMAREGFQTHAVVKRTVFASLGECIKPQGY
jgi:hypothetical protein